VSYTVLEYVYLYVLLRHVRASLLLKLWHHAHTRCQCYVITTGLSLPRLVNTDVVIQENSDLTGDYFPLRRPYRVLCLWESRWMEMFREWKRPPWWSSTRPTTTQHWRETTARDNAICNPNGPFFSESNLKFKGASLFVGVYICNTL